MRDEPNQRLRRKLILGSEALRAHSAQDCVRSRITCCHVRQRSLSFPRCRFRAVASRRRPASSAGVDAVRVSLQVPLPPGSPSPSPLLKPPLVQRFCKGIFGANFLPIRKQTFQVCYALKPFQKQVFFLIWSVYHF